MSYDPGYQQQPVQQPPQYQPQPTTRQVQQVQQPQPTVLETIRAMVDQMVTEMVGEAMAEYRQALSATIETQGQISNWSGDAHMRIGRQEAALEDIYGALATLDDNDKAIRELIVDRLSGDVGAHYRHVQQRYKTFITAEAAALNVTTGELVALRKRQAQEEENEKAAEEQAARDAFGEQTARDMHIPDPMVEAGDAMSTMPSPTPSSDYQEGFAIQPGPATIAEGGEIGTQ
jgi:hypothetical protein